MTGLFQIRLRETSEIAPEECIMESRLITIKVVHLIALQLLQKLLQQLQERLELLELLQM